MAAKMIIRRGHCQAYQSRRLFVASIFASSWLLTVATLSSHLNRVLADLPEPNPRAEVEAQSFLKPRHTCPSQNPDGSWPFAASIEASAAGFFFENPTDLNLNLNLSDPVDAKLWDVLGRDGPDMRSSRPFRDESDVTLNVSKRAWSLLHKRAELSIKRRVWLARPVVMQMLCEAKVSDECRNDVSKVFDGATRMESWAVKILGSWGSFPPVGVYEGTYSDPGDFHTCVSVKNNPHINHSHYCSLALRPVMPSRPDYDTIVRSEPRELVGMFDMDKSWSPSNLRSSGSDNSRLKDAMTDILEHAQYFHYVYFKWGSCWPIACSPFDVRRLLKFVGRRKALANGPVKCYSLDANDYLQPGSVEPNGAPKKLKMSVWDVNEGLYIGKPDWSTGHYVSLGVLAGLFGFLLVMTALDLYLNRLPNLNRSLEASFAADRQAKTIHRPAINVSPPTFVSDTIPQTPLVGRRSGRLVPTVLVTPATDDNSTNNLSLNEIGNSENPTPGEGVSSAAPSGSIDSPLREQTRLGSFIHDCSIFTSVGQFFTIPERQLKYDILCLNGIRCLTMMWILLTHTMMFNDWSAFGRTREVELALNSLLTQPLFNGSYLVDTFFIMSGLLSSYHSFRSSKGQLSKFNSFAYIIGRWLRLTPQVVLVSLIFIVVPMLMAGPHWFPLTYEYSENCLENWWVSALHLQVFYRTTRMCSFVSWWVSLDSFYHVAALPFIWLILATGHRLGVISLSGFLVSQIVWQGVRHYQMKLPPNILSTIPQSGAMWSDMVQSFHWQPYSHAVSYFLGFYTGYIMARKRHLIMDFLNTRRAIIGWTLSMLTLIGQSYSTYGYVIGAVSYGRVDSMIFYQLCSITWTLSICWIIIACHHGFGGFMHELLSARVFLVLSKASYLVYLSHFNMLFIVFGHQNLILEPTVIIMLYLIVGNIFVSTTWGVFLAIVFEQPWLKMQSRIMKYL